MTWPLQFHFLTNSCAAPYLIFGRKQNDKLANLKTAIRDLPHVWSFDNDDLRTPFRQVAVFENGQRVNLNKPAPGWLTPLLA